MGAQIEMFLFSTKKPSNNLGLKIYRDQYLKIQRIMIIAPFQRTILGYTRNTTMFGQRQMMRISLSGGPEGAEQKI